MDILRQDLELKKLNFKIDRTLAAQAAFIDKMKSIHGDRYDYSLVDFKLNDKTVTLRCKKHDNIYTQEIRRAYNSYGCIYCQRETKIKPLDQFIMDARATHGDKYDYSKVVYEHSNKPVTIICKVHGEFLQRPANHIKGQNCPKCVIDKVRSKVITPISDPEAREKFKNLFIEKAIKKYGDEYNYDKVVFMHSDLPVTITCKIHGDFTITPHTFLRPNIKGCKKCSNNSEERRQEYIDKAIKKYGDIYDYSKLDMNEEYIYIYCKLHDVEFRQLRRGHLAGTACKECYQKGYKVTKEEFISRAISKFGNLFTYDKVNFVNMHTPVTITCTEHEDFDIPPTELLRSDRKSLCPICVSSKGEKIIYSILKELKIKFNKEYKIPTFIYRYDFYLPEFNLIIEYHGGQHFISTNGFFRQSLEEVKENDKVKESLAKLKGYRYLILDSENEEELTKQIKEKLNLLNHYYYNGSFYSNANDLIIAMSNNNDLSSEHSKYAHKFTV